MPVRFWHVVEDVETDREFELCRVEIDHVVGSRCWNVFQEFMGQVAVRIDDAYAFAVHDVLENQIPEQGCFSGSHLAEHIDMLSAVNATKTTGLFSAPSVADSDWIDFFAVHGLQASLYSKRKKSPFGVVCVLLPSGPRVNANELATYVCCEPPR